MTRNFALVPLVFALCACALSQVNPNPTDIRLSRGDLEVRMSDGTYDLHRNRARSGCDAVARGA